MAPPLVALALWYVFIQCSVVTSANRQFRLQTFPPTLPPVVCPPVGRPMYDGLMDVDYTPSPLVALLT